MGKRQREESLRVQRLKERVKQGNLPCLDPLVDGKLLEFDKALVLHYKGFKVCSGHTKCSRNDSGLNIYCHTLTYVYLRLHVHARTCVRPLSQTLLMFTYTHYTMHTERAINLCMQVLDAGALSDALHTSVADALRQLRDANMFKKDLVWVNGILSMTRVSRVLLGHPGLNL